MKTLRESIGSAMLRINANPNVAPVVSELMTRFTEISRHVEAHPQTVFADLLHGVGVDKIMSMLAVHSSNNMKTRCSSIMSSIFSNYVDRTYELRTQLDLVDKTCSECVELMLLTQYADDGGNVSWANFSKDVALLIASRAREGPEVGEPVLGH